MGPWVQTLVMSTYCQYRMGRAVRLERGAAFHVTMYHHASSWLNLVLFKHTGYRTWRLRHGLVGFLVGFRVPWTLHVWNAKVTGTGIRLIHAASPEWVGRGGDALGGERPAE